ncbi:MAG: hypothetical protein EXR79_01940 [Myxococcales bacterium]|nr:hypothetical protein [Myxococcales bacterium]
MAIAHDEALRPCVVGPWVLGGADRLDWRVAPPPGTQPPDAFAVLGLPRRLLLDEDRVGVAARGLMRELHPDRFHRDGPEAVARAQWHSSLVNDAVRTLRGLERRAALVVGFADDVGRAHKPPPALLERVFDWNEQLDEGDAASRGVVAAEVATACAAARLRLEAGARQWDVAQLLREQAGSAAAGVTVTDADAVLLSVLGELRYLDNLLERLAGGAD